MSEDESESTEHNLTEVTGLTWALPILVGARAVPCTPATSGDQLPWQWHLGGDKARSVQKPPNEGQH